MAAYGLGAQAVGLRLGGQRSISQVNVHRTHDVRLVGLIKDYTRLHQRKPFSPSFSTAFRVILLIRFFSAMYSGIADCDETFNYWEPLHLLTHPPGPDGTSQSPFQTWEYSPQFAIRSWFYLAQYVPIAGWLVRAAGANKRSAFFSVRIVLAIMSSVCEAKLVQAVADVVNARTAKYLLVLLVASAGLYESATALLPSTFAMYSTTLGMSYALYPSRSGAAQYPSSDNVAFTPSRRTLLATVAFASGAMIGWPFALVLAVPFVLEECFLASGLLVSSQRYASLVATRLQAGLGTAMVAAWIAVVLLLFDTLAYGRVVLVPLNIITYNILSARRGAGPTLYGVEPWHYYLSNLTLNFGPALPLALLALPAILFTQWYESKRFASVDAETSDKVRKDRKDHTDSDSLEGTSPANLLVMRLAPFYVWLALLTLQPHKEERFMFPAYPLLCLNAAITLTLARGWLERIYTDMTKSSYKAARSPIFSIFTSAILLATSLFSLSRVLQVAQSYHAPISLLNDLSRHELPRVVANLFPHQQSATVQDRLARGLPPVWTAEERLSSSGQRQYTSSGVEKEEPVVDLSLLVASTQVTREDIRLCYGKEWFRFPTTYLVPDGVTVDFIKSDFDGILPKHFTRDMSSHDGELPLLDPWLGWMWPRKKYTRAQSNTYNDLNREESDQYVDITTCDYLIDVDYPRRSPNETPQEPRYTLDDAHWTTVQCHPFLDGTSSRATQSTSPLSKIRATIDRTLWLPSALRGNTNTYGDYCLLRTTRSNSLANHNATL